MRKLFTSLGLAASLVVAVAACESPPPPPPRTWNCPPTIPGAQGEEPIKVILTVDDTGQPATPDQIANNNGPALACEPDANKNNVGDETEVEMIENAANAGTYDD